MGSVAPAAAPRTEPTAPAPAANVLDDRRADRARSALSRRRLVQAAGLVVLLLVALALVLLLSTM